MFEQEIVNLSEPEKRLQRIIKEIGKNEPTFSQQRDFAAAWDDAIAHLMSENKNLDLHAAGRILHQVCEQARGEIR